MKRVLSLAPLLLTILPLTAAATTIHVAPDGGEDYLTIGEAAASACVGDTTLVAPGTYRGASNREIEIPCGGLSLLSEAGPDATVIDCEFAGRALTIRKPDVTVRGFTFTCGSADQGGAIRIGAAGTSIEDCRFTDNRATTGGALFCDPGGAPDFERCVFARNTAGNYGGAGYFKGSRPFLYECGFEENAAGVNGGALSMKHGTVAWLMDCSFDRNTAPSGGAIYMTSQCLWWWDEEDERSLIGFSTFSENEAERGGAVFVNARCRVEFTWCILDHNRATWGGAFYGVTSDAGMVFVQSSTITGNAAHYGAGVCTSGWYWDPEWSEFRVSQSIIAFSDEGSAICRLEDSYSFADHSVSYGNAGGDVLYGGDLNINADPLFCGIDSYDLGLCENSPALPGNNPWGLLIGARPGSCGPCDSPVEQISWGAIKARYR
jgi:predicted outer membrane repeat protein